MSTQENNRRRGTWLPFTAILLLAIGILLLLNTTGVVGWSIWWQFFRFWPVILIAVGLNIILAPRFPMLSALVVALIFAAGIGAAYLSEQVSIAYGFQFRNEHHYSSSVDDIHTLEMDVDFGLGALAIDSDASGNEDALFTVLSFVMHPEVLEIRKEGIAEVTLSSGGGWASLAPPPPKATLYDRETGWNVNIGNIDIDLSDLFNILDDPEWEIGISPDVIVRLDIEAGAADLELDLRDVNVETLDVAVGVADVYIDLPNNAGHTTVYIDAGAADIDISVPDGVAARIESDSGMSSIDIDDARFLRTGGVWQSPDYAAAQNRVEISIDTGASSVSIY